MKLRAAVRLIRVPQWTKNAFVLAPLFFSGKATDGGAVVDALAAVLTYSLVASVVYVLNDTADRHEDAEHPTKRHRPLASGALSVREGALVALVCALGAAAIGLGAGLPWEFWLIIGIYVAMNAAYSRGLRDVTLADVVVIAAGFVLRILAGTTALEVEASSFIVLCTGLLALLLALGKRRSDLDVEDEVARASLKGYTVEFIDTAIGTLSAAVIAFYALFTVSDYAQGRFDSDLLYVTTFPVVIGVVRYLQVVMVEHRHGSPTDIALRDRPIQVIVATWAVLFFCLTSL